MLSYFESQWNSALLAHRFTCVQTTIEHFAFFLVWKFYMQKIPLFWNTNFFSFISGFKDLKIANGKCYQIYIHSLSYISFYSLWQRSAKLFCKGSHSKYTGLWGDVLSVTISQDCCLRKQP